MKKCGLLFVFAALCSALLLSCLGEDGQKLSVANQPGVVDKSIPDSMKIQMRNGIIYADSYPLAVDDNDCVIVSYSIDFGLNFNTGTEDNTNNTFKVEVQRMDSVQRYPFNTESMDTVTIQDKNREQMVNAVQKRYAVIKGYLFLYTECRTDSILNEYELSFDPDAAPVFNGGAAATYPLYLRAIAADTIQTGDNKVQISAFNISALLEKKTADTLRFQVRYVSGFNKDTTAVEYWKGIDYTYPVVNTSSTN